jgi:RHS repeat-associated protein
MRLSVDAIVAYIHDGDGNLVKSIINNVVTYYVGRHYHKTVDGANVSIKKFYAIGMSQVAVRTNGDLQWILTDHLSSASVSASVDGTLVSEVKYSAYGEIRYQSGSLPTKYQYTGQLSQMEEIGLHYFVARWMDPLTGHFVQADTIVPSAGNALTYNRYAYARYNPIKYNDPSGHDVGCAGRDGSNCSSLGQLSNSYIRAQIAFQHNYLVGLVRTQKINDRQAFSRLSKFAAAYTPNDSKRFVNNMGAVLTGHAEGKSGSNEIKVQAGKILPKLGIPYKANYNHTPEYKEIVKKGELMQSGYATIFQDPGYDKYNIGGNQAHHYWFFTQIAFETRGGHAVLANFAHETILSNDRRGNSPQDFYLGVEGAITGEMLRLGIIEPSEVSGLIETNLTPGSRSSYYYENWLKIIAVLTVPSHLY